MASSRKRDFSNDDDEPTEENTPKDGTTTKRQLTLTIYKKRTAVNAQDAQKTATASESLDTEAFITPKNIIKHESTDDEDRAISPSIPTPPLDRSNTHTSEVYLSWNTACPGDRLLVQMRDKGENWNTIHRAWTDLTGERQGNRTLPTRYRRLKANFTALEDAEVRVFFSFRLPFFKPHFLSNHVFILILYSHHPHPPHLLTFHSTHHFITQTFTKKNKTNPSLTPPPALKKKTRSEISNPSTENPSPTISLEKRN